MGKNGKCFIFRKHFQFSEVTHCKHTRGGWKVYIKNRKRKALIKVREADREILFDFYYMGYEYSDYTYFLEIKKDTEYAKGEFVEGGHKLYEFIIYPHKMWEVKKEELSQYTNPKVAKETIIW